MGGCLQPYVMDERCWKIYSTIERSPVSPDESGFDAKYANDRRVLDGLTRILSEANVRSPVDGDVSGSTPRIDESRSFVWSMASTRQPPSAITNFKPQGDDG
jgi:hypothetical protein